jgi:hypothetical protein
MPGFAAGPSRHPLFLATLGIALSLAAVGCGGKSASKPTATAVAATTAKGIQGPSEVALEPVSKSTANPFTRKTGKDKAGVKPPKGVASSGGGAATFRGNLAGLYGGTLNYATCNASQLVNFLDENFGKARAWAATEGITVAEIHDYVASLTPVILRTDTRVTNHGYVNGVATAYQAVLQAGTAVFVNRYGLPVIKCYCGNPLTAPLARATPIYTGPPWTTFSTTRITIIQKSTTIIKTFRLYDPSTGEIFARPAGTDGTQDSPPPSQTTSTTQSTPPPQQPSQTTQTTQSQPQAPQEQPSASFSPNPGRQGDNFVLSASGFQPNTQLSVRLVRPDGVAEQYVIQTGDAGTGAHTFTNTASVITGTYSATVTNPNTGASATASVTVEPA